ncbi:MAG: glycosyltransferase 87 family protein [Candidatus Dormibacteraceae bacterium]
MKGIRPPDLLLALLVVDLGLDTVVLNLAGQNGALLAVVVLSAAVTGWYLRTGRPAVLYVLVVLLFVTPESVLILLRPAHAAVDDALTATQAAAQRLLSGHSPYGHDYISVAGLRSLFPVAVEFPVNPIFAHYPYPPGPILLAVPFHATGLDYAWLWPPAALLLAAAAHFAAGRVGLMVAALNPLLLIDYLNLFNDLLFMAAALTAVGFLLRGNAFRAGLLLGVALALKQTAVVFVPVALIAFSGRRSLVAGMALSLGVTVLPFFLSNPTGMLTDTAAYFYGSGTASFPIRGLGLPGLLLKAGLIPSRWDAYPAALIQIPALAAWLGFCWLRFRKRTPTPSAYWLWTGAVAAILFCFGRTLAPNYITIMVVLLGLGLGSLAFKDQAPMSARIVRGEDPIRDREGEKSPA